MFSARSPAKLLNLWFAQMEALILSASISWGSSWRSCDSIRVRLAADRGGRTILIQHAYWTLSQQSEGHYHFGGSILRTLDLSKGTTDALSSEGGSLFLQFGKVLEERHSVLRNTDEMVPGIYSMSGVYLADS
jgi:hypothetical protein